jgi:hemerythrin-like domain-containing protein
MKATARYRRHHTELIDLFHQVIDVPEAEIERSAGAISRVLSRLYGLLSVHLALEDRSLYPRMRNCSDASLRRMAQQYEVEMGNLKERFELFYHQWLQVSTIQAEPRAFSREAKQVIGSLLQRIEKENREFYPLVDEDAARTEPAGAGLAKVQFS